MLHETVKFTQDGRVSLRIYVHDRSQQQDFQMTKRPAVIVLPGGAYGNNE
ncbi:hypothetical protein [Sporomusa aerivorans]